MSSQIAQGQQEMIAVAAYFRAERRGFSGGDPVADWLEAEADIARMLEEQSAEPKTKAKKSKLK